MAVGLPGTMKSSAIKEASKGRETEKKKGGDCQSYIFNELEKFIVKGICQAVLISNGLFPKYT